MPESHYFSFQTSFLYWNPLSPACTYLYTPFLRNSVLIHKKISRWSLMLTGGAEQKEGRCFECCISVYVPDNGFWVCFFFTSMTLLARTQPVTHHNRQVPGADQHSGNQPQPGSGMLMRGLCPSLPNCILGLFSPCLQFVIPATYSQRNTCYSCNKHSALFFYCPSCQWKCWLVLVWRESQLWSDCVSTSWTLAAFARSCSLQRSHAPISSC